MKGILPFILQGVNLFITAIMGAVFLPILSNNLSVQDVGIYSQILAVLSLAILISGAGSSNYNYRFLTKENFNLLLNSFTCFLVFLLVSLVVSGTYLSVIMKVKTFELIIILLTIIIFGFFKYIHSLFYANQKHIQFVGTNLIEASIRYILSLVLVFYGGGYLSYFFSNLISAFFVLLLSIIYIIYFSKWYIRFEKKEQKFSFALKYSSTFMLSGIAIWILTSFDILLIGYFLNSKQSGIYSLGYTLGFQCITFVLMIINNVVEPKILSQKNIDKKSYLNNIVVFITLGLPIILFIEKSSSFFFEVFFNESYTESSHIMVLIAFSSLLWGIFKLSSIKFAKDLTEIKYLKSVFIAAFTNIFLNIFFINIIGIKGAAVASIISYSILAIIGLKSILPTKEVIFFILKYFMIYITISILVEFTIMKIEGLFRYYILVISIVIYMIVYIFIGVKKIGRDKNLFSR